MKISTRKIRAEDAKFIHILSAQMGYKLTLKETTEHIQQVIRSRDNCAFVATSEEKIIGWIHAFKAIRIESNPFIEIGGLVVDEDYRRKGVGKMLVNRIRKWCITHENNNLRVRCNRKRSEAHTFYFNLGFKEVKEQKVFQIEILLEI